MKVFQFSGMTHRIICLDALITNSGKFFFYFSGLTFRYGRQNIVVGMVTRYGLGGPGFEKPWGPDRSDPNRPMVRPTLPSDSMGTRSLFWG